MTAATWTADQWLAWLERGPTDPVPSRQGLQDCAEALRAEIDDLRADLAAARPGPLD